jgi:lipopolysaccharide export system protein LptA
MRILRFIFSVSALIPFVLLAPPRNQSFCQERTPSRGLISEKPIVIHSDTLEFDQKKKVITFEGKVKARSEDMVVDCQKMIMYYHEDSVGTESSIKSARIDKIIALGDVVISRSDGSMARAGKAVFYQDEERVVLTENPSVQQGPDVVEGHRIVVFLGENRSIIEGGASRRVKATIFPEEEKKSQ